jgi:hypothetical protein
MRKDKQFLIARCTVAEKAAIREIADQLHVGQSEVIRDALSHFITSHRGPEEAPHNQEPEPAMAL